MKKTLLAMFLAGSTMTVFAQTGDTATANTMNQNASNINTWNGVQTSSTSWAPDRDPQWTWNNYGVWNSSANWNANSNATSVYGTNNMDRSTANNGNRDHSTMPANMHTDELMNSAGEYKAYGTTIPYLPQNVQLRFNQDYPGSTGNTYTWNQYGDWYHTYQMNNGRLTQYFIDQRGASYSLALPVLQTYVPENIVTSALSKYGSNLYSIAMVKTNTGNDTYAVGLLDRGQISMQYLDENGVTVNDVWRTDTYGQMQSTQSNAAMSDDNSMHHDMDKEKWDHKDDKSKWHDKKDHKKEHHNK